MGAIASLRATDCRAVFRLIGECRELAADPLAWREHLIAGTMRLVGARVGMGGAIVLSHDDHTNLHVALGWEAGQAETWGRALQEHVGEEDPFWQRLQYDGGFLRTVRRCDYVADREWYQLQYVDEYWRLADVDRLVLSGRMCRAEEPTIDGLVFLRAWSENRFSRRERQLVRLLHDEVAPMIGRQLAAADEPSAGGLTPRLRQVLDCLLDGNSEKQVAVRLGLARQTVNYYIKSIYRHYRVSSRAELMARWIRYSCSRPLP